jgi:hypothetical protein
MKAHEFTIIASGPDPESDDFEDRFFEAGCDDATVGFSRGVIVLEFAREADNLASAINSAIEDVRKAGALVERIEPDWLVSLSDIAERANLTRAAITNYAKGDRGKAFPLPVARVTTESPLWDWTEVARWLFGRRQVPEKIVSDAEIIRRMNDNLEREHGRERRRA